MWFFVYNIIRNVVFNSNYIYGDAKNRDDKNCVCRERGRSIMCDDPYPLSMGNPFPLSQWPG